jgi:hypothetical protein
VSTVAPRLVTVLKDIHADAVNHIGTLQKKQVDLGIMLQAHHVTEAALTAYKGNPANDSEVHVINSLLEKYTAIGAKLEEQAKEIGYQLVEMYKGLEELTEDLRTVDPDFGKDLGPELPLLG